MLLYSTQVLRKLKGTVFCFEKGLASHPYCGTDTHRVTPQAATIKKILMGRNLQLHHSSVDRMFARN